MKSFVVIIKEHPSISRTLCSLPNRGGNVVIGSLPTVGRYHSAVLCYLSTLLEVVRLLRFSSRATGTVMAVTHRRHEWNDPLSVIFTIVVVAVIVYMVTSYPWRPPAPEASSIISTAFSMLSSSTAFQCSVSSSFANRPPSHAGHSKARTRGDSIRLLVLSGRRRGRPPNLPKIKCYAIRNEGDLGNDKQGEQGED